MRCSCPTAASLTSPFPRVPILPVVPTLPSAPFPAVPILPVVPATAPAPVQVRPPFPILPVVPANQRGTAQWGKCIFPAVTMGILTRIGGKAWGSWLAGNAWRGTDGEGILHFGRSPGNPCTSCPFVKQAGRQAAAAAADTQTGWLADRHSINAGTNPGANLMLLAGAYRKQ